MTEATLAFLRHLRAEGPWQLSAIALDGSIKTKTFGPDTTALMLDWLEERDGHCNLHFLVNVPRGNERPTREKIARVDYLHCDVDPRVGEPLEKEQERIRRLLTDKRPSSVPEPTTIIFSGGGYQALWKLREPVVIDGDLARAEDIERRNRHLANVLDGDACGDVARLLRLPGTMNLPDAKKAAKGRVPALADLVWFKPEVTYSLEDFAQAPPKGQAEPTAKVTRLENVDELDKWKVPDRVKVIIVQGHHPDERKDGDNSRSAWLFDAICQLVRAQVPDDVIFGIITDKDFGISASVLDKGTNAARYATRQIERAKEEVKEPDLAELNARFFIVGNYGGRCVVAEEYRERNDEYCSYGVQRRDDFCARFAHRGVTVGKRKIPLGRWWLDQKQARRYDRVLFAPGKHVDEDAYNLWRGFSVQPRSKGDCSLFLDHVRENVAGKYAEWLLNWMARAVQQPGEQAEVAVVLQGGRGVGKSFFARQFGSLFGPHFLAISNPRHLIGNFNAHLEDCIVLLCDEAFYAGDRRHASVLKSLITERTLAIERKGYDLRQTGNRLHLIMASNAKWIVPAGLDERRFLVLEVSAAHQQDTAYFGRIAEQMKNGGREALLDMLLHRDITGWDHRRAPDTEALSRQKADSLGPVEEAWHEILQEGELPPFVERVGDLWKVHTQGMRDYVREKRRDPTVSYNRVSDLFKRLGYKYVPSPRPRGFMLPPLEKARKDWNERFMPWAWDEGGDWDGPRF